ncbi:MAG TPA: acyl-CoA thioesterase II [Acidimicrobiia bacterium]|nr:acyl-CoA thioesterase II [Acidimicrobiia bacterium]HZQ78048.1 acyl-CoA thioesterase II [Acidimicrobiia bacterium]
MNVLEDLIHLLDLEPLEVNLFRGVSWKDERPRVFGGQVAGQALVAAGRTVDDGKGVHSLHAYFLRPGDPTIPIVYEVDRIRDGKSFTTRRVVAIQRGEAIFNLQASFHRAEDGFDHQVTMPEAPAPESLPRADEMEPPRPGRLWERQPVDIRYVDGPPWDREPSDSGRQLVWIRADGTLPDDPLLHVCIVTYASDYTLLGSSLVPHGVSYWRDDVMMASLDHAMWFHRPFRADEWLLYSQTSPSASGARGLAYGGIFRRDGTLVVSVVQEGLIRPIVDPAKLSRMYKS